LLSKDYFRDQDEAGEFADSILETKRWKRRPDDRSRILKWGVEMKARLDRRKQQEKGDRQKFYARFRESMQPFEQVSPDVDSLKVYVWDEKKKAELTDLFFENQFVVSLEKFDEDCYEGYCKFWNRIDMLDFWGLPSFSWRGESWNPNVLMNYLVLKLCIPDGYVLVNVPRFVCKIQALCVEPRHTRLVPKYGKLHLRFLFNSFCHSFVARKMRWVRELSQDFLRAETGVGRRILELSLRKFLFSCPVEEVVLLRQVAREQEDVDGDRVQVLDDLSSWIELPESRSLRTKEECLELLKREIDVNGRRIKNAAFILSAISSFPFETHGDRMKTSDMKVSCLVNSYLSLHPNGQKERLRNLIRHVDAGICHVQLWEAYHGRLHPRTVLQRLLNQKLS